MTKFRLSESKAKQAWTLPNVRNFDRRSKSRLLTLLVLLLTAASGAWAQNAQNVYSNALNTTDLFNSMTYIDVNGDATTSNGLWTILDNATYIYSSANAANDWLVTLGLVLEAGVTYTIAIDAIKPTPELHTYTETFEVKVGTAANADALSGGTAAIATTEVTTSWTTYQGTFTPTEDGTYYVGIHATSPANQNSFSIRNLTVDVKYYTVTLDDGNVDTQNWTITPAEATDPGVTEGQTVTLTYNGGREVKSITAKVEIVPEGAIKGKFTVNADGKQVYFAKGNLRYASGAWSFFDNQYDYYTSYSEDAWDKFGWSTSATTYGMNTSTSGGTYSGDFVDWGSNSDLQTALGTGWFTLSSDEWTYLFNTRSASTVGGTANGRYAKAKVNNVQGVILFPDTYTHPDGVTAPTGVNSTDATGWNGNNYSSADWTKMESAGCVFLPGAGYRNGSTVDVLGAYGYYWSATANNTDRAYYVNFFSGYLIPADDYSRFFGCCVRLVRQVTE